MESEGSETLIVSRDKNTEYVCRCYSQRVFFLSEAKCVCVVFNIPAGQYSMVRLCIYICRFVGMWKANGNSCEFYSARVLCTYLRINYMNELLLGTFCCAPYHKGVEIQRNRWKLGIAGSFKHTTARAQRIYAPCSMDEPS